MTSSGGGGGSPYICIGDFMVERFSVRDFSMTRRWTLKSSQLQIHISKRGIRPPVGGYTYLNLNKLKGSTREESVTVLYIQTSPQPFAIEANSSHMIVFKGNLSQGKATIKFPPPIALQVLIAKANPNELLNFLNKLSRIKRTHRPYGKENLATPTRRKKPRLTGPSSSSSSLPPQLQSRVRSPEKILRKAPRSFSEDQRRVLRLVLTGKSVFLTGSAGTGKSFLLKFIINTFPTLTTFPTACTGAAACQINGSTIHHFASIGKGQGTAMELARKIMKMRDALKSWTLAKLLIVDEISMMDANMFDKLEMIARILRKNSRPFGGIQLLLCGDFFQLPPVTRSGQPKNFCFEAQSWKRCINIVADLKRVFRQDDNAFIKALEELRQGKCSSTTKKLLDACKGRKFPNDGILPTTLLTHKAEVDEVNNKHLRALKTEQAVHTAKDKFRSSRYGNQLSSTCPAREKLVLKIGAQVTLIKNISVSEGLVNGSRGVVTKFQGPCKYPRVRFTNKREVVIGPEIWTLKVYGVEVASRQQVPLDLGWAISIHKSQGMSLDRVSVALAKVFEFGQSYVALSRAKSLESLNIISFDARQVKAHQKVVKFYREAAAQFQSSNQLQVQDVMRRLLLPR